MMLTVAVQHSYPVSSLHPAHPVLAAAAALQYADTQCVVETVIMDAAVSTNASLQIWQYGECRRL
jgi:hypothetical protein